MQTEQARKTLEGLLATEPSGALAMSVAMAAGEAAETATDHAAALAIYEKLAADKTAVGDEVLARLGRTAQALGISGEELESALQNPGAGIGRIHASLFDATEELDTQSAAHLFKRFYRGRPNATEL